ncbi:MAG: hypothetical protein WC610_03535 [Patescibacteria group bacterium]
MQNPSSQHQKLVSALIGYFINNLGYEILSASIDNYADPVKQGRHEPDIIARDSSGVIHIAEAKLGDDLVSNIAKEQFEDFSNRIMASNNMIVPFHIVVYKENHQRLLDKLYEIGLSSLVGNRIKIWTL